LVATVVVTGCGSAGASVAPTDGAGLVNAMCGRCHPLQRVEAAHKNRDAWTATVERMRSHGVSLTDQQAASIVDYLTKRDGGS
jgi:hypothetical protein